MMPRAKGEVALYCYWMIYCVLQVGPKFQVQGMRWECTVMTTVQRGEERWNVYILAYLWTSRLLTLIIYTLLMRKMRPKQAESDGIYEDRAIGPGVISTHIKIQDRCCSDLFLFDLLLSMNIWWIFKNETASRVTYQYGGRREVLSWGQKTALRMN